MIQNMVEAWLAKMDRVPKDLNSAFYKQETIDAYREEFNNCVHWARYWASQG